MWFAKLKKEGDSLRLPPLPELGKREAVKPEPSQIVVAKKFDFDLEDVPKPPAELKLEEMPKPPSKLDIEEFELPSPEIEEDKIELPLPEPPKYVEKTLPHYNFEDLATEQKTKKEVKEKAKEPEVEVPETKPAREIPSSTQDTSLWLANGMTVKDINELSVALKSMDDKTFHYHVNMDKNEIADWVAEILKDEALAERLAKVHKRKDAYNIVERSIGRPIIKKKKDKIGSEEKPVRVSKRKAKKIMFGEHPEASRAALNNLSSMKPAVEIISAKEELKDIVSDFKKAKESRKKSALDALTSTLTSLKPATDLIGRAFPIKKSEKSTSLIKSQKEVEKVIEEVGNVEPVSIIPIPEIKVDESKRVTAKPMKKEKSIEKKKMTKDILTTTPAPVKPATDFIGKVFAEPEKSNLLEKSQKEIEKAMEEVKDNESIPLIPKLEIKLAESKMVPAKPLKKERPEKKKKLTKNEKEEMIRIEFKSMLQKAHEAVDTEKFDVAKKNLILAKRMFRHTPLGKERKFLEYEMYDIENRIKIKTLRKIV